MCQKVCFFSMNKLNNFIKAHKDPIARGAKRNVVYKINCNQCEASYVGQTGRNLDTRISEHKKHISSKSSSHSVITDHRINLGHDFDWDNCEILDVERFYNKRLIAEMIHINRQKKGLNLQTDTDALSRTYTDILNKI
ncbi:hypothetical protein ALC62_09306 [Cyphomyrmex costatus]|uniref:GIY-YIG domain-containing protein n=1 Tax=Cyphomyrmex costatus TaxID=456900 RepID=A0A151K2R0_9HYME|nr:hypothetical protein ALC62_09306 [Cyphomyrmex costatus]